jgi:hypothetical protein
LKKKSGSTRPLGTTGRSWEDNIEKHLKETEYDDADWIVFSGRIF